MSCLESLILMLTNSHNHRSNRPALDDVTSASVNMPLEAGSNVKRQKVDDAQDLTNQHSVAPCR